MSYFIQLHQRVWPNPDCNRVRLTSLFPNKFSLQQKKAKQNHENVSKRYLGNRIDSGSVHSQVCFKVQVSCHPQMKIAIVFLFSLAVFSRFTEANLLLCALLEECDNDNTRGIRRESQGKIKRLDSQCSVFFCCDFYQPMVTKHYLFCRKIRTFGFPC